MHERNIFIKKSLNSSLMQVHMVDYYIHIDKSVLIRMRIKSECSLTSGVNYYTCM